MNNIEIKEDSPVAIVLDEKEKDYMIISLENDKYLNVEHYNKSIDLEDFRIIEYVALGDVVGSIVNVYNKVLKTLNRWDDSDLAEYLWKYVKNVEEFEGVRECFIDKDENTTSERNMDKLSPYIETMINNGFTFDELERRVSELDKVFMKNEVKKELDNMFKSWISNK